MVRVLCIQKEKEVGKKMKRKSIPKNIREKVYEKYDGRCAYCGQLITYEDMQVDHIEPLYQGRQDEIENYNPSCRMCNFYKHTKDLEQFRKELEKLQERLKKVYIYRLALKHGLIVEKENRVTFYFEKGNN